jgi:hypothetical protein
MSQPVFLNAAPAARMPDGSKNEWKDFFDDGGVELEYNGWPPLLWLALFKAPDIRWARLVDDEDLDSEGREELAEFGDTRYPYLATSTASALATYASRRQAIQDGIGEAHAGLVKEFESLIESRFPAFVLCRTAGLSDVADAGPALEKALADFDGFVAGDKGEANTIAHDIAYFHELGARAPSYQLAGVEMSGGDAATDWPQDTPAAAPPPPEAQKKTSRLKSELRDWGSALLVGLPTVAVYFRTASVALSVLCFCVICTGVVLLRVKPWR